MSWFYSGHLQSGGASVRCYVCKQPMMANPAPISELQIAKWKGVCLDCAQSMGAKPECELAVDDLIAARGYARRLLDGGRAA